MNDIIYPRSPRETMTGRIYLPRYIDKIRLHLAGRRHPDPNHDVAKQGDNIKQQVKQQIEQVKTSAGGAPAPAAPKPEAGPK